MKYPITASIIFVQMDETDLVTAYVGLSQGGGKERARSQEFRLGTMSDATDLAMWIQMATASVCDAL